LPEPPYTFSQKITIHEDATLMGKKVANLGQAALKGLVVVEVFLVKIAQL
jgi:hypothetical protein